MKKIKMFTHTDLDGIGCGLVLNMTIGDKFLTDISYVNYNEVNEEIEKFIEGGEYKKYSMIFVTDISVNEIIAEKINNINSEKNQFILLDHHETSGWLNKYDWCTVESVRSGIKISGTVLTLNYITSRIYRITDVSLEAEIATFALAINSYDTWSWNDIDCNKYKSKELNDLFYILGRKKFIEIINMKFISGGRLMSILDDFKILLELEEDKKKRYIKSKSESIIEKEFIVEDKIYKFGVVFAEQFVSELGNKLNELNPQYDFIMIISDGKVSLRTIHDEIKVNEIAELFYGGGHPKASGFEYDKSIKNTIISDIIIAKAGTN